jgi:hypothetical protein
MTFQDELRRKKKELEGREAPVPGARDPSEARRHNDIAHFKTKAIPLIDGLLKTFFSEGYPRLKWKIVNEIPATGLYQYRPEIMKYPEFLREILGAKDMIPRRPPGPYDLKVFKVATSESTFVIRLGFTVANTIQLVEYSVAYAGGEERNVVRSPFLSPFEGNPTMEIGPSYEMGLSYSDEMIRLEVTASKEGTVQKALEDFLLVVYEREHAEGFWGTGK